MSMVLEKSRRFRSRINVILLLIDFNILSILDECFDIVVLLTLQYGCVIPDVKEQLTGYARNEILLL